ncbi:hypothetical protein JKP88DRAFT_225426 [Tribonema minus]|uniref:Uncharacterized protein n=1 Tax=Tribonema minus TaxID=303371 RepID=A0A836CAN1_9STRA|nr:hypothetical protein JKP88DRAFT_225426 [Tribonema minus]
MPNEGLCKSCWDKVEWRKKYRKYRPLTQPATCRDCSQRTVTAAYHKICQPCAKAKGVCAFCCDRRDLVKKTGLETLETVTKEIEAEALAGGMTLREKKAALRAAEKKFRRRTEGAEAEGEGEGDGEADSDSDGGSSDDGKAGEEIDAHQGDDAADGGSEGAGERGSGSEQEEGEGEVADEESEGEDSSA